MERAVVVGLGNPGPNYAATRHNAGALVLDVLAGRIGSRFSSHKSRCVVASGRLAGTPAVLAKPTSFMNESGGPVTALVRYYKAPLPDLIVVHDELDLPFGTLRLKLGGGDGGHNGLRSISGSLGRDYLRVRVGIGRPPGRQDPADYVLREFSGEQRKDLPLQLELAADAVEALISDGLEAAQSRFNS